jgi:hypothetical protein
VSESRGRGQVWEGNRHSIGSWPVTVLIVDRLRRSGPLEKEFDRKLFSIKYRTDNNLKEIARDLQKCEILHGGRFGTTFMLTTFFGSQYNLK